MTEEHVTVRKAPSILAMDGKTIIFRLPIDGFRMKAEGNGTIHANEVEEEDRMEVSISVWEWPEKGIGGIKINHFNLNQKEIEYLQDSADPEFEIQCIDPSLRALA